MGWNLGKWWRAFHRRRITGLDWKFRCSFLSSRNYLINFGILEGLINTLSFITSIQNQLRSGHTGIRKWLKLFITEENWIKECNLVTWQLTSFAPEIDTGLPLSCWHTWTWIDLPLWQRGGGGWTRGKSHPSECIIWWWKTHVSQRKADF